MENERKDKKFNVKSLVFKYRIPKKDEGAFFTKFDCLIEKVVFDDESESMVEAVSKGWSEFFTDIEFISDVEEYIKKTKLPYKLLKENGLKDIRSVKFLTSIIVSVALKITITENQGNTIEDIMDKTMAKIIGDIGNGEFDEYLNNEINGILKRYTAFNFPLEDVKQIVSKYSVEQEKIYKMMVNEYLERQKANTEEKTNAEEIKENCDEKAATKEKYELVISSFECEIERLNKELEVLENRASENLQYALNRYKDGIISVINALNEKAYGNVLDRLYCYANDIENINDKDVKILVYNMFASLFSIGIKPIDIKMGEIIELHAEDIGTKYRTNKDSAGAKNLRGVVRFPGWSYKDEKIIAPMIKLINEEGK